MENKHSSRMFYPGQADDEITQRVFYKSIMAVLPILFACLVVGFVSLYGIYYGAAHDLHIDQTIPNVSGVFLSMVSMGVFVLSGFFFIAAIWIWRNNRVVVTNQHLVDVDQTTLFRRTVSTLTLEKIQDVTAEVKGPTQTIFQYGTLIVQTAGERENFKFDYIPYPYQAEKYILEIHKQFADTNPANDGLTAGKPVIEDE